ncbi:hypothetical protein ACH42_08845 [Endozoicomonas sp. (ex Bugula neritina AB1)]|nr:hypothetical protein ACH42_08845 [Endozoicomonas sp. (ex Bugula neritina AB1)]
MTESVSGSHKPTPINPLAEQYKTQNIDSDSPGFDQNNSFSYRADSSDEGYYFDSDQPPTLPEPDTTTVLSDTELNNMEEQGVIGQKKAQLLMSLNSLNENKNISLSSEFENNIRTLSNQVSNPETLDSKTLEKVSKIADRLYDAVFSETLDKGKLYEIMMQLQNQVQENSAKSSEELIKIKTVDENLAQDATVNKSIKESNENTVQNDTRVAELFTATGRRKERKSQRADRIEERLSGREERIAERQEKRAERIAERQSRRSARQSARMEKVRERNPERAERMQERLETRTERQSKRADKVKDRQSDRAESREDRQSDRLEVLREWNPDRAERIRERQEKRAEKKAERQEDRRDNRLDRADDIREKNPERAKNIEERVAESKEKQSERAEDLLNKQTIRLNKIREKQEKEADRKLSAVNSFLSFITPNVSPQNGADGVDLKEKASEVVQGIETAQAGLSQIEMMKILHQLQQEGENQEKVQEAILALESGDIETASNMFSELSIEITDPMQESYDTFLMQLSEVPKQISEAYELTIMNNNLIQRNNRV